MSARFARMIGWLLLLLGAAVAATAQTQRIAAVVNTDVISALDVNERVKMLLFTSGLPDTPEQRRQMEPRVVRSLIDESLQRQEAKRLSIGVREAEIAEAVRQLEQRNRIPAGEFDAFLAKNGLSKRAVEAQIGAQILWQKVLARRVTPSVEIGEEEIDQVLARIAAARGQTENRVAEIVLAIDNPREEAEVKALADRLVTQIRAGADFASVAAQFSQSASAAVGGDLGWIQAGQLDPVLDRAVAAMTPGQLAPPLQVDTMIHILLLTGRRQIATGSTPIAYSLRQMLLPLPAGAAQATVQATVQRALELTREITSCADFAAVAARAGTAQGAAPARLLPGALPAELRRVLDGIDVARPTPPMIAPTGVQVIFLCDREAASAGQPNRAEVADQLGRERLDMLARRYLRNLQRAALIEVRQQ